MENQPQAAPQGSKSTMWVLILVVIIIVAGGAYYFFSQDDGTNTNNTNTTNSTVNTVANQNANAAVNDNVNIETNTNEVASTNAEIDTTDWNTYIDEQSGLTFMYPAGWKVINYDNLSAGTTFGFRPSDLEVGDESWVAVGIAIRSNPDSLDLETFYSQATGFQNPYDTTSSVDTMVLNGNTMTYFESIPGVITISKLVFPKNGNVIEVWIGRDKSYEAIDNLERIFFEIASQVK